MVLDEATLAELRGAHRYNTNLAGLSRDFGISLTAIYKYSKVGFRRIRAARRALPIVVRKRRALVRRIAAIICVSGNGRIYRKFGSASQIVSELDRLHHIDNTSPTAGKSTVVRDLHANNLQSRKRRLLCSRELEHVGKRREFKRRMLAHFADEEDAVGKRILFSDETWLSTKERTGDREWCEEDQQPNPIEDKPRRNLDSFQVWAAVGWNFKSKLIFFPKCREKFVETLDRRYKEPTYKMKKVVSAYRVNSDEYVNRCLEAVKVEVKAHQRWLTKEHGLELLFQEDGARCHHSGAVGEWFAKEKIMRLADFPPFSPDLNMIEIIWKQLHAGIGKRHPNSEEELVAAALATWEEDITQEVINKVVLHFEKAIKKVE